MESKVGKEFTPNPVKWACPKCKGYYKGKVPVLDFTDKEFTDGKMETPPTMMVFCHGNHPIDPYEEKIQ